LARLAWERGEAVAASDALPVYVRDDVARTTAQRLAAKTPA
jgi:tRNA threonylcarbamoyladenosine biosynthesis protein TsaB